MNVPSRLRKRVLIVDDSATLRAWLRAVINDDANLEVVGEAADAFEARERIKELKPDVVTLDVEMPKVSGLTFLERLMEHAPMPVVMVSSSTAAGSEAALEALSLGAVDCLEKPMGMVSEKLRRNMTRRILAAALSRVQPRVATPVQTPTSGFGACDRNMPVVLIGSSTGGVAALEQLLPGLDADGPPVVIVQHMPGDFLTSFALRMNRQLSRKVSQSREGMTLSRGDIVFAPAAGQHTEISLVGGTWRLHMRDNTEDALHCPSVDVLFHSAARHGDRIVGVMLTGLGRDGAEGMLAMHQHGARTVCQDEATCVIYGMPKTAKQLGAVDTELPLSKIADEVNLLARKLGQSLAGGHG